MQLTLDFNIVLWCASMQILEAKISSHQAEAPDIVLELKAELDSLRNKLDVSH